MPGGREDRHNIRFFRMSVNAYPKTGISSHFSYDLPGVLMFLRIETMIELDRELRFLLEKSETQKIQWQWLPPMLTFSAIWFYGLWCLLSKLSALIF
jgi:hypothetical protein